MRIERLISFYGGVCLCLIVFHWIRILWIKTEHTQRKIRLSPIERAILVQIYFLERNQNIEREHFRRVQEEGSQIRGLLNIWDLFSDIEAHKEEEPERYEAGREYLQLMKPAWISLLCRYVNNRPDEEAICMANFIIQMQIDLNMEDMRSRNRSLYQSLLKMCASHELYAQYAGFKLLCQMRSAEDLLQGLKTMDAGGWYNTNLIYETLLNCRQNPQELCERLWESMYSFSPVMQTSFVTWMRLANVFCPDQVYDLYENPTIDREVRFACLRYFARFPDERIHQPLMDMIHHQQDETEGIVAASVLASYPSYETLMTLKTALSSSSWYIRKNAAESIHAILLQYPELMESCSIEHYYRNDSMESKSSEPEYLAEAEMNLEDGHGVQDESCEEERGSEQRTAGESGTQGHEGNTGNHTETESLHAACARDEIYAIPARKTLKAGSGMDVAESPDVLQTVETAGTAGVIEAAGAAEVVKAIEYTAVKAIEYKPLKALEYKKVPETEAATKASVTSDGINTVKTEVPVPEGIQKALKTAGTVKALEYKAVKAIEHKAVKALEYKPLKAGESSRVPETEDALQASIASTPSNVVKNGSLETGEIRKILEAVGAVKALEHKVLKALEYKPAKDMTFKQVRESQTDGQFVSTSPEFSSSSKFSTSPASTTSPISSTSPASSNSPEFNTSPAADPVKTKAVKTAGTRKVPETAGILKALEYKPIKALEYKKGPENTRHAGTPVPDSESIETVQTIPDPDIERTEAARTAGTGRTVKTAEKAEKWEVEKERGLAERKQAALDLLYDQVSDSYGREMFDYISTVESMKGDNA